MLVNGCHKTFLLTWSIAFRYFGIPTCNIIFVIGLATFKNYAWHLPPPHMGCVVWTMFDKQLGWWFEKKVLNDRKKKSQVWIPQQKYICYCSLQLPWLAIIHISLLYKIFYEYFMMGVTLNYWHPFTKMGAKSGQSWWLQRVGSTIAQLFLKICLSQSHQETLCYATICQGPYLPTNIQWCAHSFENAKRIPMPLDVTTRLW